MVNASVPVTSFMQFGGVGFNFRNTQMSHYTFISITCERDVFSLPVQTATKFFPVSSCSENKLSLIERKV